MLTIILVISMRFSQCQGGLKRPGREQRSQQRARDILIIHHKHDHHREDEDFLISSKIIWTNLHLPLYHPIAIIAVV